jgi:hypothetical protein
LIPLHLPPLHILPIISLSFSRRCIILYIKNFKIFSHNLLFEIFYIIT